MGELTGLHGIPLLIIEIIILSVWYFLINAPFMLIYKRFSDSFYILYVIPMYELLLITFLIVIRPLLIDIGFGTWDLYFKVFLCIPVIPTLFFTVLELCKVLRKRFLDKLLRRG